MSQSPEQAILRALLEAVERVSTGFEEARELLEPIPNSPGEFNRLNKVQRIATAALLKRFEQMQDLLARLMRTALLADGADISTLTARDIANRMEKLRALPDAARWSEAVRLRNRLAHEYPTSSAEQFDRLSSALDQIETLHAAHASVLTFLERQSLINPLPSSPVQDADAVHKGDFQHD